MPKPTHSHCWHAHRGAIWMVLKNGHIVQECCRCEAIRTIHAEHAKEAPHVNR